MSKIKATCKYGVKASPPPFMNTDNMDPWTVTLLSWRRRLTVPFYMGMGHNGKEPTAADVMHYLCSDAAGFDNASGFEDWCSEYGYETDSRKAEATYRQIERQAKRLRQFLGDEYEALVFSDEDAINRRCEMAA
jgi:hypothetical protein